MFQQPLIIALLIGLAWKAFDLVRAPHDRMLRLLVACLLLLTAGEVLSIPGPNAAIDAVTALGVGKIVFNAVYMAGLGALSLLLSTVGGRAKAVRTNVIAYVVVVVGMIVSILVTPAGLRGHSLTTPHMAVPGIAAFYVIGNLYFIFAYTSCALWSFQLARLASRHLAIGLRVTSLGLAVLALTSLGRVVWVFLRIADPKGFALLNTVNWSAGDWAMGVVLVGICYSAGAQLLSGWRSVLHHRRMYRQLTPLWTALAGTYPELVLNRTPFGDTFRLRGTHQRFYRRLIECRDGLVRLSPYLTQVAPDADLSAGSPRELAQHITEALAAKPATEDPAVALRAVRVALPATTDLNADARELIAISLALSDA